MNFIVNKAINKDIQLEINTSLIFQLIRKANGITQAEIARTLELNPSTVSRIIEQLYDDAFIIKGALQAHSTPGKPSAPLFINPDKGLILCINFSESMYQAYLMNYGGSQIKYKNFGRINGETDELIHILKKISVEMNHANLQVVGFCVPAEVSSTGQITSLSLYSKWTGLHLADLGWEIFGKRTIVEKDVFVSTFAEIREGIGLYHDNFLYLKISRDFSAGIVHNGIIIKGANCTAGQATFSIINDESRGYINGTQGYIDDFACFENIAVLKNNKYYINQKNIKKIIEIHSALIANLVLILNPSIVVFAGMTWKIQDIQEHFLTPLHHEISSLIPIPCPLFLLSKLKGNAISRGLAHYILDNIMNNVFPYIHASA